jgi:hypothetical protein
MATPFNHLISESPSNGRRRASDDLATRSDGVYHARAKVIDVSSYPAETEVPSFRSRVVCAKCGSRGNKIDVRPNWKEQPRESLTGKVWR